MNGNDSVSVSVSEDVIDLGLIVEETKGSVLGFADNIEGQRIQAGLSDD